MQIGVYDGQGIRQVVKEKLLDGWVVLAGHSESLSIIEENVYKPGTKANRDYEVIVCPNLPYCGFGLGKKTKKLREFMGNPSDFERTLGFEVLKLENNKAMVYQLFVKPDGITDEGIEELLQNLHTYKPDVRNVRKV